MVKITLTQAYLDSLWFANHVFGKSMHIYIIGMTESGKTTLAKSLCKDLKARGFSTSVLDPLKDPSWDCDYITDNALEFLEHAKTERQRFLFVDEGGEAIGRYNKDMEWLATQSRHYGHSCVFISQSITQTSTIIRQQCSKVFAFACGSKQTELLAEEYRDDDLKQLGKIPQGEFFIIDRFTACVRGRVDFSTGAVYIGVSDQGQSDENQGDN